jgi:hypothetical protein
MAYADDSPQVKAALVSGRNRRQRAAERQAREERRRRQIVPGHHASCRCDDCLDAMVQFVPTAAASGDKDGGS